MPAPNISPPMIAAPGAKPGMNGSMRPAERISWTIGVDTISSVT